MKHTQVLAIVAFFACSILSLRHARAGQTTSGEAAARGEQPHVEARRLWELAIAAKGGRTRLDNVRSLLVSIGKSKGARWSEIERGRQYERLYVFPCKLWAWEDMRGTPFGLLVEALNYERGLSMGHRLDRKTPWKKAVEGGPPSSRYELLREQLTYLMESRWVKPVPVELMSAVMEDRWVKALKTQVREYEVTYYLDEETHLPLKVHILKPAPQAYEAVDQTVYLDDYSVIDGIRLPRSVRLDDYGWWRHVRYQINVDYDDRIFEEPPQVENGPDGWRRPPQASK